MKSQTLCSTQGKCGADLIYSFFALDGPGAGMRKLALDVGMGVRDKSDEEVIGEIRARLSESR